ncbi:MAG: DinB family protein [Cryomorphaceae bacterium]|nr:hypothetical protein [Flavobacteriales bacterium]
MIKIYSFIALLVIPAFCSCQNTETELSTYGQIEEAPENITGGNVLGRFIDGLIFRYYWATEGLNEDDLTYRPSDGARNCSETIHHLLDLSEVISNAACRQPNLRSEKTDTLSFEQARAKTLSNLSSASERFKAMPDDSLETVQMLFKSDNANRTIPIWNLMNGPVNDAIYHVGQIVSFRRTTGNPIKPGISMMYGTGP